LKLGKVFLFCIYASTQLELLEKHYLQTRERSEWTSSKNYTPTQNPGITSLPSQFDINWMGLLHDNYMNVLDQRMCV
jgi:hypothetical protein